MPEKISILKESGETISSNIVSIFMVPDTQKKYLISTENTVDPHGLTVLHVSEIADGSLQKVATDEEWSSIKTIMRAIISGNVGSYQYLQSIDSIKAKEQYSRDISVSASAAKQMTDNFAARDVTNIPPAIDVPAEAGIFPSGNDTVPVDEVAPGIGVVETPVVPEVTGADLTPAPVEAAPVVPVEPVPVVEQPVAVPAPEPVVVVEPVVEVSPEPVVEVVPEPVQQVVEPVVEVAPAPAQVVAPVAVPAPVVVEPHMVAASPVTLPVSEPAVQTAPEPVTFVSQADLYAAQPIQYVPAAQIPQEVQYTSNLGIKFDVNPSFAPNASLEEVVLASQEMFIEGVRNLVQSIQEKVYREMYNKETELKAKEEMLNQREKMLNEQMMSMMSNFAAMQSATTAVAQPAAPAVEVETENK